MWSNTHMHTHRHTDLSVGFSAWVSSVSVCLKRSGNPQCSWLLCLNGIKRWPCAEPLLEMRISPVPEEKPCTSKVKNKPWSHNTQCYKHKAASREHLVTLWSNLCWFDGGPLTTRSSCRSGKSIVMQTENCFHCHLWVLRKFSGKCKVWKEQISSDEDVLVRIIV